MRGGACCVALAGVALLGGCAVIPHAAPDPAALPARYLAASPEVSVSAEAFWSAFGDAELTRLLIVADANNRDLAAAAARLAQARALARGANAARLPEVDGRAGVARQQNSRASGFAFGPRVATLYEPGFDASWELDLFGRLSAEARAARRDTEAALLDREALRVTVAAETARLYFSVRALQARTEVLAASAAAQADLAGLARSRTRAGLAPETDALRLEGLAASSRAQQAALRADLADAVAGLALIVGRTASEIEPQMRTPVDIMLPLSPLVGAPADLLARRPDIRRDLARLQAADARTAARVRDRLPRLTLSGSAGYSATDTAALFTGAAGVFSIGTRLAGPVIDFGRRRAVADEAVAVADERDAVLQTTVLTAVREVERDLAGLDARRREQAERTVEVERSRTAKALLQRRYLAGLQTFNDVLDAERQALASADAEILARQAAIDAALSLWKSLGGAAVLAVPPKHSGR